VLTEYIYWVSAVRCIPSHVKAFRSLTRKRGRSTLSTVAKSFLVTYFLLFLNLPSFSIYTFPLIYAQSEDEVTIEERLKKIEEILININTEIELLKLEIDNIHATYLTSDFFDVKTDSMKESIDGLSDIVDVRIDSL